MTATRCTPFCSSWSSGRRGRRSARRGRREKLFCSSWVALAVEAVLLVVDAVPLVMSLFFRSLLVVDAVFLDSVRGQSTPGTARTVSVHQSSRPWTP
jgi:hypothetical protein